MIKEKPIPAVYPGNIKKRKVLKMKLDTIYKKIIAAGLIATYKTVISEGIEKKVICVDTNYNGAYPTKESFEKIEAARKIAKGHKTETRGYYTALFIY